MGKVFEELSGFLNAAERERNTANEDYSQNVDECLKTTLLSLSALMDHLRSASNNVPHAAGKYCACALCTRFSSGSTQANAALYLNYGFRSCLGHCKRAERFVGVGKVFEELSRFLK